MAELLLLNRVNTDLNRTRPAARVGTEMPDKDITLEHTCLVAEYMSHMASAGYSDIPQEKRERERGAWRFLSKFPDPRVWLDLPVEEQLRCDYRERNFVHYLFLRHLLPMPPGYILVAGPHMGEMGRRLIERDTYERYRKLACRLGYYESGIRRQFQCLLCLMAWAQKPMDALTLVDLDTFLTDMMLAYREMKLHSKWRRTRMKDGLPYGWYHTLRSIRNVLYHLGILPQLTLSGNKEVAFEKQWRRIPPGISNVVHRYLQQLALSFRPGSLKQERCRLFRFFSWLAETMPEITEIKQIQRRHIEAFKEYLHWAPPHNRPSKTTMCSSTKYKILAAPYYFFQRITEWQWPEAPDKTLMFYQDLPPLDQPLPRFLGETEAARFLQTARSHADLFTRVCGVTLMLTGLRKSEFLELTTDCIVQIGESYWLRVPFGKTHRERFVPLHPEVKQLLDEWITHHSPQEHYDFLFTMYGRRIGRGKVDLAVKRIAREAGIPGSVPPHRLRHTLATMAINRGMPLESIAALLGHRSLSMTLVYAKIGNRTVQQEYSAVSQRLEQLCNQVQPPDEKKTPVTVAITEGTQMRRLRQEHWRMLGNGYCTRPKDAPCEYETICESCPCFSTTIEFLPILHKQRQDAEDKGQTQRANIFSQIIERVETKV
jgi:site-specific recombinase XerD